MNVVLATAVRCNFLHPCVLCGDGNFLDWLCSNNDAKRESSLLKDIDEPMRRQIKLEIVLQMAISVPFVQLRCREWTMSDAGVMVVEVVPAGTCHYIHCHALCERESNGRRSFFFFLNC